MATISNKSALVLLSFLREYVNEETKDDMRFSTLNESVDELEQEVYKMPESEFDDIVLLLKVDSILGKTPQNRG